MPKPKNKQSVLRTNLRRKRLQLSQSIPPIKEQSPPYKRSAFRLGHPEVHCVGSVKGLKLDLDDGIDSRHTWGESIDLAFLEVKPSNIDCAGVGEFANKDIAKNQLLTEYYGTIVSEMEELMCSSGGGGRPGSSSGAGGSPG
jgi:hypothetical protein